MSTTPASCQFIHNLMMPSLISNVDRCDRSLCAQLSSLLHRATPPGKRPKQQSRIQTPHRLIGISDGVPQLALCASVILHFVHRIISRIILSPACFVTLSCVIPASVSVCSFIFHLSFLCIEKRRVGSCVLFCSPCFISRIYVMKTRFASRHGI